MAPVDDAAAQRDLNTTLERFRGDPRAALGLRADDDAAVARRAFMALCKTYHPAKFARFAPATVRLSNEVFLSIRRAYESVAAAATAATAAMAATATPNPARAAAGSGPPPVRRTTPPAGVPVMARPSTPPPSRDPVPRASTPPPRDPVPRPPTSPIPAKRDLTAPGVKREATASGRKREPTANPAASPAPPAADASPLEKALELTRRQQWPEARAAFAELATQHPGDARYRAYLHYARGWEAFTLGKDGEARAEWQRSLACDPSNGLARWALESTGMIK